jgi:hypothetical protein
LVILCMYCKRKCEENDDFFDHTVLGCGGRYKVFLKHIGTIAKEKGI